MHRTLLGLLGVVLLWSGPAVAQTVTIGTPDAEFRAEPNGTLLARLVSGVQLSQNAAREEWRSVTLEGWIWAASVGPDNRRGYTHGVSAEEGENLRTSPNGEIIARLRTGMVFDSIDAEGAWIRVRRQGWVVEEVLNGTAQEEEAAPEAASAGSADAPRGPWGQTGEAEAALVGTPGGDTLARIRPTTSVQVLGREGDWTRVRLDGWVRSPELTSTADADAVLTDVSAASLTANPEAFQGRLLEWTLRFIALDEAEEIRSDLYEGEPFLLTRGPGDETGFVYIAVPSDLLDDVQALSPLQEITVVARVRTGRSALTESPVLDLVELK